MNVFVASRSERRYQQIAEALAGQISNGDYREGQRIKAERELAAEHSVSRTTVREALLALEIMGYVDIRIGAGVYVLPRHRWSSAADAQSQAEPETGPHEILDVRRALEARSAYLAAEHANPKQIGTLRETVDLMAGSVGNLSVFDRADEAFHLAIAEMSNNTLLKEYTVDLWSRGRGALWSRWYEPTRSAANRRRVVEDHRQILGAIKRGRPMAAMTAMHAHIDILVNRFLDLEIEPGPSSNRNEE